MNSRTKRAKATPKPLYPMVIETFREPEIWGVSQFRQEEPSCFNGVVSVRRFRLTFELIDEADEVIAARLNKLWDEGDNHHYMGPLSAMGKIYGANFDSRPYGSKRKRT